MKLAPLHPEEKSRLKAVHELAILDTKPEARFDALTKKAVAEYHLPICTISIIDESREWYKSRQGVEEKESTRDISFCGHAILATGHVLIIEDTTKDERFADNPAVTGSPFIRFYAGVALKDRKTSMPIGVFCIKDTKPRAFGAKEISKLLEFAVKAEDYLNEKKPQSNRKPKNNKK